MTDYECVKILHHLQKINRAHEFDEMKKWCKKNKVYHMYNAGWQIGSDRTMKTISLAELYRKFKKT